VQRPPDTTDPLAGVEVVLIDGNNLLHALAQSSRGGGGAGTPPVPSSAIVGRIRGAIPAGVRVELVFDGSPSGVVGRLATGMTVAYARRATADDLILDRLTRQLADGGPASTWPLLVVTDDRELRDGIRSRGGRSAGTSWLLRRIAGTDHPVHGRPGTAPAPRPKAGTALGHGRPPRTAESGESAGERSGPPHGTRSRRRGAGC